VKRAAIAALVMSLASAAATAAPTVHLAFRDGRVTLSAKGATPAQILAEWARVGGTRIVNGDRVAGPPLVLELKDVPEVDALDIVLRGTGGFIATARAAESPASASNVEQVTVFPEPASPAPRAPAADETQPEPPPPAPIYDASGAQRIIGPDGQPVPDDQDGAPAPAPPPASAPPSR
jgi:hypothetical protein